MAERGPSWQELVRRRQAGGFVGRREQLGLFEANLGLAVDDPRKRFMFSLNGSAGVGKTFLVRQFVRVARERGVLTGYVDESAYDVVTAVEAIVADLAEQGARCREFPGLAEEYRQRRHELDADPATPAEVSSALVQAAVRVGLRIAGDIPVVGAAADEVDPDAVARRLDRARAYLGRKLRGLEDVRLLLSPVEVLSTAFVRDLAAIAAARPVALFLDTFERTGAFLEPWLLDVLAGRYGDLPAGFVVTIAGQAPLDANRWGDYLAVRTDFPLEEFTDAEARQLLSAHGVTDPRVVEVVLELSGRLPVWVATLASTQPASVGEVGDPSGDAVERFLKWEHDPRKRAAALTGALPRNLGRDLFALVGGDGDFEWVRRLPFVVEHPDGYRYHDIVRAAMLRVLRRDSAAEWGRHHRALAAHHRRAADALGLDDDRAAKSTAWQKLALEESYHDLCDRAPAALPAALGRLVEAIGLHPTYVSSWRQTLVQAGRDSGDPELLAATKDLPEVTAEGAAVPIELLDALVGHEHLDKPARATALAERGEAHRLADRYPRALADFTAAVALNPDYTWAVASRGQTYQSMRRYEEALADLDRAVELAPEADWIYGDRGRTYLLMGRYDDAIADFDRAIELDPKYTWAMALRARALRSLGRDDEALADLDRAVELEPDADWILGDRARVYAAMERYDDALADFDKAISIDPEYAWAVAGRGNVHRLAERYAEAMADLDRAIALDPEYGWAYGTRGLVHRSLGQHEKALADLDRALELNPEGDWVFLERGLTHRMAGRHDAALADLDRAVEADPEYAWAFAQRGQTHREQGRRDQALADLDRAVALDPDLALAFSERGEIHCELGRYEAARADFDTAITLDPDYVVPLLQRGEMHRLLGRFDEALADYDGAVERAGDIGSVVVGRGEVLHALGRLDEALAAFDRALAIDPGSVWARGGRGRVLRDLGRHEDAVADLSDAVAVDADDWWEYQLGLALIAGGRRDEGLEHVRRAVEAQPGDADGVERFNTVVYGIAAGETEAARRRMAEILARGARGHPRRGRAGSA